MATEYDSHHRPFVTRLTSGGTTYALTQTSYDADGRVQCVASRMNPGQFAAASLPANACTLNTTGSYGPDRITRTTYDDAGQAALVQTGYGVSGVQADEMAATYSDNGRTATVTDANGNMTTYDYDGHDRLVKTRYPSPTTDGVSSTTDYEQLTLDEAGNVTSRRLRDGTSIGFSYDTLNRTTAKDLPGAELDVSYTYDLLGHMLTAATSAQTLTFTYDALGRNLTQVGPLGTVTSAYDAAGRRTQLTYPGSGLYVNYDYDTAGDLTKVRENGASSGVGVLATWAYDDLGRRTTLTRGNGTTTAYGYDAVSRLSSLAQNLSGATNDLTLGYSYNPASQITSHTRSNDAYAWGDHYAVTRNYTPDGLNRYSTVATVGGSTIHPSYDARGNLTAAGGPTYTYSSENLLTAATGGVTLAYDPATRLYQTSDGTTTTRFAYDGADMIAEYNGSSALQRRYVFDPATGSPLVWYEGTGTSGRRFIHTDERGSVIATTNSSGTMLSIDSYDEFGIPASTNTGRFGYTGQAWLPELGMAYYRARIYSPTLGRFMQTDPIGFGGGMNLYVYVGNEPISMTDPLGLRRLNGIEIAVARTVFHSQINFSQVNVEFSSLNPVALLVNSQNRAVTIDNTIYFPSRANLESDYLYILIHELTHVLQYQSLAYDSISLLANQLAHGFNQDELYSYPTGDDVQFDLLQPEAQARVIQDCAANPDPDSPACKILSTNNQGITKPYENLYEIARRFLEYLSTHRRGTVTVEQDPEPTGN